MWTAEAVLVCALAAIGRNSATFPPVALIDARPPDVSNRAHGFVRTGEWRVYVITSTAQFVRARRAASACGRLDDIRWIASVLAHEEWHLTHGIDEPGAYVAQLAALVYMGAGPESPLYSQVWRSIGAVRARLPAGQRRSPAPRANPPAAR